MKLSTFLLALLPIALAQPLIPEEEALSTFSLEARADNAAAVVADLKKAGANTKKFKATLDTIPDNAKTISSQKLVELNNESAAILKALQAATSSASGSSAFTAAQSKTIFNTVTGLEPTTFSTLDDVVAHKTAFDNAGVTSLVVSDLKKQKAQIAKLGTALKAKATAEYKKKAGPIAAKYAQHFQSAINSLG